MTTVQYIPPQGNFFNKSQRVGTQEEVVLKWGKNHERYGKEIHTACYTQLMCSYILLYYQTEEGFNTVSENCSLLLKYFLTVVQHKKVNDSSVLVLSLILPLAKWCSFWVQILHQAALSVFKLESDKAPSTPTRCTAATAAGDSWQWAKDSKTLQWICVEDKLRRGLSVTETWLFVLS